MPIRSEASKAALKKRLARYPRDWKAISLRIRERSEGRCECVAECGLHPWGRCVEKNGRKAFFANGKIVLTVAHLVSITRLPVDFHVTRTTEADQIFKIVGRLMAVSPKALKLQNVVDNGALAEFHGGPEATSASFIVSLPDKSPGLAPGRPVIGLVPARPIWIRLTGWGQLRKPFQTTGVIAEPSASAQMKSRNEITTSAPLAAPSSKTALQAANKFVATGRRAGLDFARSLLRGNGEDDTTDNALLLRLAPSRTGHGSIYHIGYLPENCSDGNLKAMCPRCHLRYDAPYHAKNARTTREAKSKQTRLALEIP